MALSRQLTRSLTRSLTRPLTGEELNRLFLEKFKFTLGSELVTNGTFDADTNWTKGTGWTIGSGTASSDGTQSGNSNFYQTGVHITGKTYTLTFDLTATNGEDIKAWVNGTQNIFSSALATGNHTYTYTATATGTMLFEATAAFVGSIDNVSVKEVIKQAPVAAFSLRKLGDVSPYACRIRRSSDNTEAQVMFDASDRVSESSVVRNTSHNLLAHSNNFIHTDWDTHAHMTPNAAVSPTGATNASEINGTSAIYDSLGGTLSNITISIYAKKNTTDFLTLSGGNPSGLSATFDLTDGTVAQTVGASNPKISAEGNDWYRVSVSVATGNYIQFSARATGTQAGTLVGGVYVYGAQVEQSLHASTGTDQIVNGDFEIDDDWDAFGSPVTQGQSTEQVRSGTYSWKVSSSASGKGIQSTQQATSINITKGYKYRVSAWIYAVDGGGSASVKSGINETDQSITTSRSVTQGQWTNITYDATANLSTFYTYVSFLTDDTKTFYVDDVTVTELPFELSEYISTPVISNDGLTFTETTLDDFVGGENLRKYSNEFNAASWGINNFNAAENNNIANPVDGAVDAMRLRAYDTGGASKHEFYTRYSATSGVQYAHSIYLKPFGTLTHVIGSDSGSSGRAAAFDLVNGTVVSNGLSNQGASIEAVGSDGWMRVTFVFTATATVSDRYIYWAVGDSASLVNGNARTDNYDADGTGQGVYAWGAQVNLGTTAKAHSKTEATIRDGNAAIVTLYNQTGGQDVGQSNTSYQPLLYSAGSLVKTNSAPSMLFDGSNDSLRFSDDNFSDTLNSNSLSTFTVLKHDISGGTGWALTLGTNNNNKRWYMPNFWSGGFEFRYGSNSALTSSGNINVNLVSGVAGLNSAKFKAYLNGSEVGEQDVQTNSLGTEVALIGALQQGTFHFSGKISEIIIFDTEQNINREDIESDINNFHNIY